MSSFPNPFSSARPRDLEAGSSVDSAVLVRFFNTVYAWMATGLAVTALAAWYVANQPQLFRYMHGPLLFVLFIVEIGLVIAISSAIQRINATTATILFLAYSAINGLLLSAVFLIYAKATLATAFFTTAGTFGAMSVYGMVTKADLSRWRTILFMALIGIVIAMVVSIFVHSTAFEMIINCAGVLLFTALTAYDTQKLKVIALQTQNNAALSARLAVTGALMLYLDFINLFLFLLRLMGDRR